MAPGIFIDEEIGPITDDHMAFIDAGYPFIDLIGLPYPHWHMMADTPDKCDPSIMKQLGMVLMEFMRSEVRRAERD